MGAITQAAAALVKPLAGSIVRRGTLGTTVTAPALVTLQSDGFWDPTDTSAAQLTVAVSLQSGVVGDEIDLVVYGPVLALSGATIGNLVFASDTAGAYDTAVGTKDVIVGYSETAAILFVQPDIIDLA